MFVSVVLPTYDRASVLGGAIESVLAQTHEEFELLVVDGGSTDGTPEVVSSFDDDRIRYRRRDEREGVSAARNTGIEAAEGEAVAFLDSDDRWHPEKLARQVAALAEGGDDCGVVYTGIVKADADGEPLSRSGASGDVREEIRTLSVPTYTSTLLARRDALRACGGFDERLGCFEDWDLCLRLARDWRFEYVDAPLVAKGTDTANVSADPDRLARAVRRIFEKHDLPDAARAQFLADAGKTHCEAGRLADARPYLRRALALDVRPLAAAAYALSLTDSPAAYDAGMAAVNTVERRFSESTGD
ncbi:MULTISPECIES: glycosyltransferase family 2 protein [Halorussus]|uniref:glycosyltransferase family 2 protein n=1 Tax=Halorussus TaxID=1070314 RepID=UPI0020A01C9D|nr:glycosyltransferase family A protein [Halorussus vallis]USZ77297.1 glycosyltransferase family 2 protein [Halorussus vallis]